MKTYQLMKRCQMGCNNLNDANDLLAECYGCIGKLQSDNKKANQIQQDIADILNATDLPHIFKHQA